MDQLIKEKVSFNENGEQLVKFISRKLAISTRKTKQLIDEKVVYVNNKCVWIAHHRLNTGDVVEFPISAIRSNRVKNEQQGIRFLYRDQNYLIIDKPAGVITNQGAKSLEAMLQKHYLSNSIKAVHRLDKYTSGCVIFATSLQAFERIIELFKLKNILKGYLAIVYGKMQKQQMFINSKIDGEEAITEIKMIKTSDKASFLRIFPKTGRTHQIRIHLARIGHPIVGDKQYGLNSNFDWQDKIVLRQMLHSDFISFVSPYTGKKIEAHSKIPDDFRNALKLFNLI